MRVFLLAGAFAMLAAAQQWRTDLMGLSDHPAGASAQDVDRFVQNVQMASPYFATLTPGDFEANREMVRRMYAYVMALEMMAGKNPALRPLAARARGAMNSFPIGYAMIAPRPAGGPPREPAPAPVAKPGVPPFAMNTPPVDGASPDLISRYDSTAARAGTVWQNADTMKQSLNARGMSLNANTAAAVGRLEGDMAAAFRAIHTGKFDDANQSLDRADVEIEKIGKVVGK